MRVTVLLLLLAEVVALGASKRHHRHHHGKKHTSQRNSTATVVAAENTTQATELTESTEHTLVDKMRALEKQLNANKTATKQGRIIVNGPLPTDFGTLFAKAVADATGCDASVVKVVSASPAEMPASFIQVTKAGPVEVVFEAPGDVVDSVLTQAADADSKLVNGSLRSFLIADDGEDEGESTDGAGETAKEDAPVEIDSSQMPYGELEPFGREDTAQELTETSVKESDDMVDQLERAEVAEEKRSVFRAITRLRGAAISSFDGIARSQTGNIDEYNHLHKWRQTHPLHHLAQEESDVSKWAFPANAD